MKPQPLLLQLLELWHFELQSTPNLRHVQRLLTHLVVQEHLCLPGLWFVECLPANSRKVSCTEGMVSGGRISVTINPLRGRYVFRIPWAVPIIYWSLKIFTTFPKRFGSSRGPLSYSGIGSRTPCPICTGGNFPREASSIFPAATFMPVSAAVRWESIVDFALQRVHNRFPSSNTLNSPRICALHSSQNLFVLCVSSSSLETSVEEKRANYCKINMIFAL